MKLDARSTQLKVLGAEPEPQQTIRFYWISDPICTILIKLFGNQVEQYATNISDVFFLFTNTYKL